MKLTQQQLEKMTQLWIGTYGDHDDIQAVIDLYESEMRPKEAAPVMWRRSETAGPGFRVAFSDGNGLIVDIDGIRETKFVLTAEDILSLPFPADPTPEEEFEAWALGKLPLSKIKGGDHAGEYVNADTLWAYAAFMAAKFPAEGGVK